MLIRLTVMGRFLAGCASVFLAGCASAPKPENVSGLEVTIKSVKNHFDGVDMRVDVHNTTPQPMGLTKEGSVNLLLSDSFRVSGRLSENVEIQPGEHASLRMKFDFMNQPKVKNGLLEIVPNKMFKSCSAADQDPDVARDSVPAQGRDVATEALQPLTCDRALRKPIRVGF